MGFRKAIYDVEEKGLDPNKPHAELGEDGRLKADVNLGEPAAVRKDDKQPQKRESVKNAHVENQNEQKQARKVAAPKLENENSTTPVCDKKDQEDPQATKEDEVSNNNKELPNNKSQALSKKKKTTRKKKTGRKSPATKSKTVKTTARKKKSPVKRKVRGKKET